jgi:hypothetical protein
MTTKIPNDMLSDAARTKTLPVNIITPSATTYVLNLVALYDYTITAIAAQTAAGTLDIAVDVDSTDVSWTTASGTTIGVSNSLTTDTAASANAVSAGDTVGLEVSNLADSPTNLVVEITYRLDA